MKKMMKRAASLAMAALLSVTMLAGCGNSGSAASAKNPALKMDGAVISMEEAHFYTYTMRLQYESYYGPEFWDMELEEGRTYGDELKVMVQETLAQMLVLNSKAKEYGVKLAQEDQETIDEYVESFKTSVGEETMAAEGITEEVIASTLEKIYTASYVYDAMAAAEEVELTEEEKAEAVCIRVQHVLISTMDTTKEDAEGNMVAMTEDEIETYKASQKSLAEMVLAKAQNGENFQKLSEEYSAENAGFEFAFDKYGFDPVNYSYMVEPFYQASWNLKEGEISGLVESDYGYHIIKCVSENDEETTQVMIETLENDQKYVVIDEKVLQMVEEAEYTISDAWEAYKVTSVVVEETTAETTVETTAK